ncbi:MAG: response regulator transcription factor [Vampirovibrionales bacterium]|nr:response regulator transcription factor [Vampirovibrionales bacterium]
MTATPTSPLKLLILDPQAAVLEALCAALHSPEKGLTVVAQSTDTKALTKLYALHKPDLVIMDTTGCSEAILALREVFSEARVYVLAAEQNEALMIQALTAGANGFSLKQTSAEALKGIIRQLVLHNACWIDPRMAKAIVSQLQAQRTKKTEASLQANSLPSQAFEHSAPRALTAKPYASQPAPGFNLAMAQTTPEAAPHKGHLLTERERDVLMLITEGRSNQEIAQSLVITQNTVKTHMKNIFHKLGVTDRTGAAVKALKEQLIG